MWYTVTSGGYRELHEGQGSCLVGGILWGGWMTLIQGKNEEGYVMIEVCPERYRKGPDSDISLNRRDIRSKFRYTKIKNSHRPLSTIDLFVEK